MAGNLSIFTFFYILPSALLLLPAVDGRDCSYYNCGRISFPYRTPDQPITCGLPGFDLGCNHSTQTPLLSFPSGQSFSVDNIYYSSKEIKISDPQGCLPKKLLQNYYLNTSGTPFRVKDFTNFSLYSCPRVPYYRYNSSCSGIYCGGGPPYSILCVNRNSSFLNDGCEFIGGIRVPGAWTYPSHFTSGYYIYLNWEMPAPCRRCTGKCTRRDATRINCNVFTPGVVASVTIAAIVLLVAVISCTRRKCHKRIWRTLTSNTTEGSPPRDVLIARWRAIDATIRAINTSIVPPPSSTVSNRQSAVASGVLGQDTLDAFPIVVIGESGRILMNMEDKTCPICLSEYVSKDTLKLLPECLHKFHADCIDEWLRAKPTCPICRTSPPSRS